MDIPAPHDSAWTDRNGSERLALFRAVIRRNWHVVLSIWAACVVAALVLSFVLPSYWRVEIVVMPVTKGNNVNISSALAGGLSGIGALLNRPSSGEDEALAVLGSRELFDIYVRKKNLLPILYADKWDERARRWDVSPSRVPTLRQAYKLFDTKIRDIDLDRRTGIVTMSITWNDRVMAAQWARDLIDLTNQQLRERAIQGAQSNMEYLGTEIRRAGAFSAQNALNEALATAYNRALQDYMFAKGQSEFAFRVIDAPTIPDDNERVWPRRSLFVVLGFILGGLLSIAAAYFIDIFRAWPLRPRRPVTSPVPTA